MTELDELTTTLRRTKGEKADILQEVDQLQQTLRKQQAEMRLTEKLIHSNRVKAENMTADMGLAELRREKTMRELSSYNAQLDKKRSQLRELEQKLQSRVDDLQGMAGPGLAKTEVSWYR